MPRQLRGFFYFTKGRCAIPQILGTNTTLYVFTTSGSLDITGDFNNSNLQWSRNNPDTTTYGKTTTQRISGLRDYSFDFAGIFNSGSVTAFDYLKTDMNASVYTLFKWAPAGSITGCPFFMACALLSAFNVESPVGGPVAMSMTLQAGAGSLSASTV
jgi:hypothetical protein